MKYSNVHSDVYVSRSVCIEMYSDMHVLVCVYLLICIITILHIEHADVHICLRIYVYTAIYIYIIYTHLETGRKKRGYAYTYVYTKVYAFPLFSSPFDGMYI